MKFSHELIDESLDLEPHEGIPGIAAGWHDKKTGFSFSIEPQRINILDFNTQMFRVTHRDLPPGEFLVRCDLPLSRTHHEGRKLATFTVSRDAIFSQFDRGNERTKIIRNRLIDNLGGKDSLFEYCLIALTACCVKYFGPGQNGRNEGEFSRRLLAEQVKFDIVD